MSGTQSTASACPCGTVAFPQPTCNLPNLPAIACRIGDFVAFRQRLLQALPGETDLTVWRPGAEGDLAVQMMEWWAYLADILTFYNERIANEAYLGTALLPESVNHLVQLLGYRPKPALGAKATLAALLTPTAQLPLTLPAGLQIQSKPGPGQTPQIFQLDQATTVQAPDLVPMDVVPASQPLLDGTGSTLWLAGKVSGIKPAERMLLINAKALTQQTDAADYAWIKIAGTAAGSDPLGNAVTQVSFAIVVGSLAPGAQAADYVLLRGQQATPLWSYPTVYPVVAASGGTTSLFLAGVARSATPGSLLLLDLADGAVGNAGAAAGFAPAFQASLDAAAFATAFNAGGAATTDNAYQGCIAAAAAVGFAAAISNGADATAAWTAGIAFASAYSENAIARFGAFTALGFTAAFGASFSASAAAAGASAAGVAANTLFDTTADCAAAFSAGLVSGFQAAGAPLPASFAAAATDFADAFAGNFVASPGAATDPGAAATAAASLVAATLATIMPLPVIAQSYAEVVWYANGDGPTAPTDTTKPPLGMPIAQIGFASLDATGASAAVWNDNVAQVTLRWGWTPVGSLAPVLTAANLTYPGGNTVLAPAPGAPALPALPAAVLLQDPTGNAAAATATAAASPANGVTLGNLTPPPPISLASPIDMLFNLLGVSRGKAVPAEVLGSGNPSVAGQDFALAQSPVTYFFDTASISGNNFSSTVQVAVNGVQWQEVQSFYNQPSNAQVFVLHEDDQGHTHVTFGDGVNGALLPTGTNNVVATYRTGAGAAAPPAGTLTVVLTPTPGLKGVGNPLPPSGGGDADQAAQLRTLAPQSVLTFNRAVSLDDYAAIALTASGVTQAVAGYAFDPLAQRPVVTLWIVGDSGAKAAVAAALAGTAVPNQGLRIHQATPVSAVLSLTYLRDTRYADAAVQGGITTALLDPDAGLFGSNVVGIAQTIYQSQIAAACLAVPGVTAIQDVVLTDLDGIRFIPIHVFAARRFIPLSPAATCSGQSYNPGQGQYFSIPNDGQHLLLTGATAS